MIRGEKRLERLAIIVPEFSSSSLIGLTTLYTDRGVISTKEHTKMTIFAISR